MASFLVAFGRLGTSSLVVELVDVAFVAFA